MGIDMKIKSYEIYTTWDANNIKGFVGQNRFLSNFWPCEIYFNGKRYLNSEAAYQAQKSGGELYIEQFFEIDAKLAKQMGKKMPLVKNWDIIKYDIMSAIVFDKFYRNKDLRQKLLDTRNKYLEETNWWGDKIWGVCDGIGENNLGKILMKIREFWK